MIRRHRIEGGGGVWLNVRDQGAQDAPAILLIHGWAQALDCWQAQTPLAERFRLVAFDLRGHGDSDKPEDPAAYTDTELWADDVRAVISALALRQPVLAGWSYGARVMASYLDIHGDAGIAGVVTVGGILAIGNAREDWMLGKGSPGLNRALYSDDDAARLAATRQFLADCTDEPLDEELAERFLAFNMACPAVARRALFQADYDIRPAWQRLDKPLLSIHGVEDRVVAPICGIEASEIAPAGDLRLYEHCGHVPFLEQPDRFNADLSQFTETAIGATA